MNLKHFAQDRRSCIVLPTYDKSNIGHRYLTIRIKVVELLGFLIRSIQERTMATNDAKMVHLILFLLLSAASSDPGRW